MRLCIIIYTESKDIYTYQCTVYTLYSRMSPHPIHTEWNVMLYSDAIQGYFVYTLFGNRSFHICFTHRCPVANRADGEKAIREGGEHVVVEIF